MASNPKTHNIKIKTMNQKKKKKKPKKKEKKKLLITELVHAFLTGKYRTLKI